MTLRAASALLLHLWAMAALASAASAEAVQFRSAPVNPTPFMVRQAQLHVTVAVPRPGDTIAGNLYKPAGTGRGDARWQILPSCRLMRLIIAERTLFVPQ